MQRKILNEEQLNDIANLGITATAKKYKISRATIYRKLKNNSINSSNIPPEKTTNIETLLRHIETLLRHIETNCNINSILNQPQTFIQTTFERIETALRHIETLCNFSPKKENKENKEEKEKHTKEKEETKERDVLLLLSNNLKEKENYISKEKEKSQNLEKNLFSFTEPNQETKTSLNAQKPAKMTPNSLNPTEPITPAKNSRFKPPTAEEVRAYCISRKNDINAEQFVDFYTAKDWMIGKNKMKDWKAAVRTWEKNHIRNANYPSHKQEEDYCRQLWDSLIETPSPQPQTDEEYLDIAQMLNTSISQKTKMIDDDIAKKRVEEIKKQANEILKKTE